MLAAFALHILAAAAVAAALGSLSRVPGPARLSFLVWPGAVAAVVEGVPARSVAGTLLALVALVLYLADHEAPAGGSAAYFGAGGIVTGLMVTVGPILGPLAYLGGALLDPSALLLPVVLVAVPDAPRHRREAEDLRAARWSRRAHRVSAYVAALAVWVIARSWTGAGQALTLDTRAPVAALRGMGEAAAASLAGSATTWVGTLVLATCATAVLVGRRRRDVVTAAVGTLALGIPAPLLGGASYLSGAFLCMLAVSLVRAWKRSPGSP